MGRAELLSAENERLRTALLAASLPLETLRCVILDRPYREMSHMLMDEIVAADREVRLALRDEVAA